MISGLSGTTHNNCPTRKRTYHLSTITSAHRNQNLSDPSLPQKSQNPIRNINKDILVFTSLAIDSKILSPTNYTHKKHNQKPNFV